MPRLSHIEKGIFMKLFNRSGYVLNFSTNDFDIFTSASVGVALCDTYRQSKGKSLMAYINEASEDDTVNLLKDLLEYYETHYEYEIENDVEYSNVFKRCKGIMERITYNKNPLASVAVELKGKFSSTYLSVQIDLMLKMQSENPTEAIGKAKELVESCCKTILDEKGVGGTRTGMLAS